jgi:phage/plasmid-associated DNA primase
MDSILILVKNRLYNIITGEFMRHSPDYLSFNQLPITYNINAKTKYFG